MSPWEIARLLPCNMTTNQVAQTIAQQIGNRAFFMMGAKNLMADGNTLTFKVGSNAKKVTHVRVTLEPFDTYRMEFLNIRGFNAPKTLSEVDGVYFDGLHQVIESNTGLALSL